MKSMNIYSASLMGTADGIFMIVPVLDENFRKKGYFVNIRSLSSDDYFCHFDK